MEREGATGIPPVLDATAPAIGQLGEDHGVPPSSDPIAIEHSDEELMALFCTGNEAAFDVLFERYADRIRRTLLRLTRNPALALDLTQVTFMSVVKARDRFTPGSCFRAWLYVIAMNAWRDHHRRHSREVVSDPLLIAVHSMASTGDWLLTLDVQRALDALPRDQREAVLLHHIEGFSFKEIADMLFLSVSAVKVRAHRGYERLRAQLSIRGLDDE